MNVLCWCHTHLPPPLLYSPRARLWEAYWSPLTRNEMVRHAEKKNSLLLPDGACTAQRCVYCPYVQKRNFVFLFFLISWGPSSSVSATSCARRSITMAKKRKKKRRWWWWWPFYVWMKWKPQGDWGCAHLFVFKGSFQLSFGFLFEHHKVLGLCLLSVCRAGKGILSLGLARRLLPIGSSFLYR